MADAAENDPPKRKPLFKRTIVRRKTPDPSTSGATKDDDGTDLFRRTDRFDELLEEQRRRVMEKEQRISAGIKVDSEGQDLKRRKLSIDEDDELYVPDFNTSRRSVSARPSTPGFASKSPASRKRTSVASEHLTDDNSAMHVKEKGKEAATPKDTPRSRRTLRSSGPVVPLDDDDDDVVISQNSPRTRRQVSQNAVRDADSSSVYETPPSHRGTKRGEDSDDDDLLISDTPAKDEPAPEFAEYVKRAREKAQREAKAREEAGKVAAARRDTTGFITEDTLSSRSGSAANTPRPDAVEPIVQCVVSSEIPGASRKMFVLGLNGYLKKIRTHWVILCGLEHLMDSVFLTWKGNRTYDTTTCASLGIDRDASKGMVKSRHSVSKGTIEYGPIEFEAWTDELYTEYQRRKEQERLRLLGELDDDDDEDKPTQPGSEVADGDGGAPHGTTLKVILKARDQEPVKFKVHPHTTAREMIEVFKRQRIVPDGAEVALYFDGEEQDPGTAVQEMDLEDMDSLEVHFK
ncbi:hypothetical protein DL546_007707 [Coniochaeta pulveracea]|uniref:Ubiquitin-like domain-containing protein n=1 Tax=Coniochaeta pulveracea TaxID=177199 RepID=A0A420YEH6_9PEZI|nr:hypothetical protein DL546_007707 [Coniochaeta pulveracea]